MDAIQEKYARLIGKVIDDRYEIQQVKGIGGMAVVLKAKDLLKNRTVAIKMLNEKNSNDTAAVRRFVNESKAVAMLNNEHIMDIYDVAFTGKYKYLVMEYIDGITLREYMKRNGPLGIDKAIDFTMQILSALQHAHEKGVVHRDIKPQNIMVQRGGKLKVTDFGIAQVNAANGAGADGVAMGTVYYISPEQASGSATTFSSDLYSVGVMLFEMATGSLPFEGDTPLAIAMMQVNNKPPRPRKLNPDIPQGLEQIILRAMNKVPQARFGSAHSMLRALEIIRKDKTVIFEEKHPAPSLPEKPIAPNGEKNMKPKTRKKEVHTMFPVILGVTTAFLLVALIGGIVLLSSLLSLMNNDETVLVEVPPLIGADYNDQLQDEMELKNIALSVTEVNNDSFAPGQIVSQEPAAGQKRKISSNNKKLTVKVEVSSGKLNFKLADYANEEYRAVQIALEKKGVKVKTEEQFDQNVIAGHVISTAPAKGTTVNSGDTVTLIVSKGSETTMASMIDVRNMEAGAAKRKLLNANFVVGKITREYSDTVQAGYVIRQSVAPGTSTAQRYTAVDLVISMGKA